MFNRIAILLLFAVSLVSAKTYTFTVSSPSQIGTVALKPGDYKLKVEGTQALLMDRDGRPIETAAEVESAERKYDHTAITSLNDGGTAKIVSVTLAGSIYKVVFH